MLHACEILFSGYVRASFLAYPASVWVCESDELAKRNLAVQTEAPVPVLPSCWSAAACAPYLLADTLVAD